MPTRISFILSLLLCLVMPFNFVMADTQGRFSGKGSYSAWLKANEINNEAKGLMDSGKYDLAIVKLEQAIAVYPHSSVYFNNLGASYGKRNKKGDLALSEAAYRKAIALEPNSWRIWFGLGDVLYLEDKNTESAAALKKALSLNPPPDKAKKIRAGLETVLSETK